MRYYRDTNLNFIYFSIFHVLIMILIVLYSYKNNEEFVMYTTTLLGLCYLFFVVSTVLTVVLKRNKVKEIQENGRCYDGIVEKLVEIEAGTTFNRFGHTEYNTAYYLKILPKDEIIENHFVYSDVLAGRKGQKISKEVLIYEWNRETYVACTSAKSKQHYEVEQSKEVIDYTWNRKCLIFANQLAAIIDSLLLLLWIYSIYTR